MKNIVAGLALVALGVVGVVLLSHHSTQGCVTAPTTAQIKAGQATNLGYGGYTPSKTQLALCK